MRTVLWKVRGRVMRTVLWKVRREGKGARGGGVHANGTVEGEGGVMRTVLWKVRKEGTGLGARVQRAGQISSVHAAPGG